MTFVIVGAGPTGVELAGTLAEVSRQTLARDFRHINTASARVILVEAGPRVLGAYTEELSDSARQQLEKLGVTVWTGMQVTAIDADGVWIGPERIHAQTVIWAAGVAASPLARTLGVPLDRAGRVLGRARPDDPGPRRCLRHRRPGSRRNRRGARAGRGAGRDAGRAGTPRRTSSAPCAVSRACRFAIVDKGMLATIGRGAAVAKIGPIKASGFFAWLLWLFVHIFFLIGFRNRLMVMIQWAWSYVTFDRGARLITEPLKEPLLESDVARRESAGRARGARRNDLDAPSAGLRALVFAALGCRLKTEAGRFWPFRVRSRRTA